MIPPPAENGEADFGPYHWSCRKGSGGKASGRRQKIQFIELGKKVGVDELKNVLDAMQPG